MIDETIIVYNHRHVYYCGMLAGAKVLLPHLHYVWS